MANLRKKKLNQRTIKIIVQLLNGLFTYLIFLHRDEDRLAISIFIGIVSILPLLSTLGFSNHVLKNNIKNDKITINIYSVVIHLWFIPVFISFSYVYYFSLNTIYIFLICLQANIISVSEITLFRNHSMISNLLSTLFIPFSLGLSFYIFDVIDLNFIVLLQILLIIFMSILIFRGDLRLRLEQSLRVSLGSGHYLFFVRTLFISLVPLNFERLMYAQRLDFADFIIAVQAFSPYFGVAAVASRLYSIHAVQVNAKDQRQYRFLLILICVTFVLMTIINYSLEIKINILILIYIFLLGWNNFIFNAVNQFNFLRGGHDMTEKLNTYILLYLFVQTMFLTLLPGKLMVTPLIVLLIVLSIYRLYVLKDEAAI